MVCAAATILPQIPVDPGGLGPISGCCIRPVHQAGGGVAPGPTVTMPLWICPAGSDHHFLGRGQRQFGMITHDAVDIPLQPRQVNNVAVMVIGNMTLVGVDEFFDVRL